jgi:hypothetical protein
MPERRMHMNANDIIQIHHNALEKL